jgi:hypothetical protein
VNIPLLSQGGAQIVSFGEEIREAWQRPLSLPCLAVGTPTILTRWLKNGLKLQPLGPRARLEADNSLYLSNLTAADAGEYNCEVENWEGADRQEGRSVKRRLS